MLEGFDPDHKVLSGIWERRQTTSNIIKSKIVGRESDEELLVEWLLKEPEESEQDASVAAIVGMGGMGKTTLAKSIYNNIVVGRFFDKCMWVCVSERPRLLNLFKKILEEVDKNEHGLTSQLIGSNALSSRIVSHLKDKKFLLVLDDVWDCKWWSELRSLWRGSCRSGSKVLITTRDVGVAKIVKSDRCHELKGLNPEQSWQLFINESLRKGEIEEDLSAVRAIGYSIVRKCRGLPLALSTVGGTMCLKDRKISVWQDVLNSSFWSWKGPRDQDDILSAIALSYMNLSSPLKQCLTYCCIFPKDFEMRKEDMLRLWIAEGFVGKEEGMDLEGIAENYLEELVACNLIQTIGTRPYTLDEQHYVLHDMIHDFALYIRGEEHAVADYLKWNDVPDHERMCASFGEDCYFEQDLPEQKLRSLVLHDARSFTCTNFAAFKWLRVLDLRKSNISTLSESIGELILLRYLNLSETNTEELPKSIIQLHDLQTLDLSFSHLRRLPDKLSCFFTMRHLDLEGTYLLEYLPKEIAKLTGLRTLSRFIVGSSSKNNEIDDIERGSNLRELHDLNNLRGFLEILHLERIGSEEECHLAQLQKKETLERLELSWEVNATDEENSARKMENMYRDLQPPSSILEITITNYPSIRLPNWMQYSSAIRYNSLEKVFLSGCKFLEHLPNFGYLPELKELNIWGANRVKVFDTTSVLVVELVVFPKLKYLYLRGLETLEQWRFDVVVERKTMPCLRRLEIEDCPKLRILPILPSLEELSLRGGTDSLEGWWDMENESSREWPHLKSIEIWKSCPKLRFLPRSSVVESWSIDACSELLELPISATLIDVMVRSCRKASFSWTPSHDAPQMFLRKLEIINSPNVVLSILERIPKIYQLESLRIVGSCPDLTSFPDMSHLPKLEKLAFREIPQLDSIVLLPSMMMTMRDRVKGLQELHLGPNVGSSLAIVQGFLQRIPEMAKLRRLTLVGFGGIEMQDWLPSMKGLEKLGVCPHLVGSLVDALRRYPPPNLRLLRIANGLFFDELDSFQPRGTMLTCSLEIDSLETSNALDELMQLSDKIDALEIRSLSGDHSSLPQWMQHLHQLRYLKVGCSDGLTDLPEWLNCFTKLKCLTLAYLPELRSLSKELVNLCKLEKLQILGCPKLTLLPGWVLKQSVDSGG